MESIIEFFTDNGSYILVLIAMIAAAFLYIKFQGKNS